MRFCLLMFKVVLLLLILTACDSNTSSNNNDPVNTAPQAPQVIYPASGSTSIILSPLLSWSCTDSDGDALSYNLYFGTTETPELIAENITEPEYQSSQLSYNTRYYWKVIASDGIATKTGVLWNFRTRQEDLAPIEPFNPIPAVNATDIEVDYTLRWSCSDPNGDALTFDLYLGTTDEPELTASNLVNFQYITHNLAYHTIYYWRIVAKSTNMQTSSPLWCFETRYLNYPPTPPVNPIPANYAIDVSANSLLRWECSDPEYDSMTFDIYLGTDEDPPLYNAGHPYTQFNPGGLTSNTTYYWLIRAWDADNFTDGPLWQFTTGIQNTPPDAPSLPWPVDGAENESIYALLRWTCSDPDGDDLFYKVYFGIDPSLDETNVVALGIDDASWDVGILNYDTTYYWKITANDGETSTTGATWSFTTESER
ncbi:MAG: hypothetical protein K9N06_01265 [Candidatus Cloacimonetes bacterium]|nr:hypothetical protein [Candidatus Cloacimonadota bacterium]